MNRRAETVKKLKIEVDTKEVDTLKEKLDLIYVDTIKTAMGELEGKTSQEDIDKLKSLKSMLDELASDMPVDKKFDMKNFVQKNLKSALESLGDSIVEFFEDTFKNARKRIMDMASYDLGNSLFSNSDARQQALRYGITNAGDNYALTQTMSELGMSSEEDLMFMNDNQREKFAERMGYWSSKYNELANKDFFNTMETFALEWNEFKHEMELDVIEFFVQNKDTIQEVMRAGIKFMETTLNILGSILDFLKISRGDTERTNASMEIVRNYQNSPTTTNVNINNTMHPSSQVLTDKGMLKHAGELAYTQLISALRGGMY